MAVEQALEQASGRPLVVGEAVVAVDECCVSDIFPRTTTRSCSYNKVNVL